MIRTACIWDVSGYVRLRSVTFDYARLRSVTLRLRLVTLRLRFGYALPANIGRKRTYPGKCGSAAANIDSKDIKDALTHQFSATEAK